jgi:hypothetical protein
MPKLKITIFGNATELLIGTISKAGANWVLEFCEELGTDIEEIWYGDLGFIQNHFGKEWDDFDNIFHTFGFTFSDKNEIQEFLNNDLERPAIKGIFINGKRIKKDLSRITCDCQKRIDLPRLNKNEVFVYHGSVDIVSMDYIIDIHEHFLEDNLKLHFIDCYEYGYMLTEIDYEGKQMARVYSGSKIKVKSGWHSLNPGDMGKAFKLFETRNFLEPKFKKKMGILVSSH